MFRGMAKLKGKNGSHYLLSFGKGDSPAYILQRAEDFYDTDMEGILTLRYREGDEKCVLRTICENCDELAREGEKFCSYECSEEAFDTSREGDYHAMVANSDIYPRV